MELLLITSRWPTGSTTEFLEGEAAHLAREFAVVRVAPMNPCGTVRPGLPANLIVDFSLADAMGTRTPVAQVRRWGRGAVNGARPGVPWLGQPTPEVLGRVRDARWILAAAITRSNANAVRHWARRTVRPDLVYTFWLGAAAIGARRGWPDARIVSRAHGGDVYPEQHHWPSIPYQEASIRSVDHLAVVSDHGRADLARRFPDEAHKMIVRRLGTADLGVASGYPPSGTIRVLSASSVDRNKRVDLIAQAVKQIAMSGRLVHWTHLGDGPELARVRRLLEGSPDGLTAALPGHVALDRVHHEMLHGHYSCFVNLSLSEGAPVSLMEAQSVGLPVVATDVGGTREVAPDGLNQLVGVEWSVPQLSSAITAAAQGVRTRCTQRRARWATMFQGEVNYARFARELRYFAGGGSSSDAFSDSVFAPE